MLDKKNVVLPTRWVAEVMYRRAMLISTLLKTEPLSIEAAMSMVHVALQEILNQRRLWLNPGVFSYNSILDAANVDWVTSNAQITLPELTGDSDVITVHDAFICYILNALIVEIEKNLVNPNFPERTFDILEVSLLHNGDTIISNLGDYRICRFEQLVREGKVSY